MNLSYKTLKKTRKASGEKISPEDIICALLIVQESLVVTYKHLALKLIDCLKDYANDND